MDLLIMALGKYKTVGWYNKNSFLFKEFDLSLPIENYKDIFNLKL